MATKSGIQPFEIWQQRNNCDNCSKSINTYLYRFFVIAVLVINWILKICSQNIILMPLPHLLTQSAHKFQVLKTGGNLFWLKILALFFIPLLRWCSMCLHFIFLPHTSEKGKKNIHMQSMLKKEMSIKQQNQNNIYPAFIIENASIVVVVSFYLSLPFLYLYILYVWWC